MLTVEYKFYAITCPNVKYFGDVEVILKANQPAFQFFIANHQITQILQLNVLMGECYDFKIFQGCIPLT